MLSYHVRSISDEELRKINVRVDEKIVRERTPKSTQSISTASAAPRPRTPPTSSDSIRFQSKNLHSIPNNEPPSIFQNPRIGGTHVSPKVSVILKLNHLHQCNFNELSHPKIVPELLPTS